MSLQLNQPNNLLRFRNYELDFSKKTHIMGVLNVTPDSFFDGGLFFEKDKAIKRALEMSQEGATLIDVGGESTRPGSKGVSIDEELKRIIPVIGELISRLDIPISIDTSRPEVAREALRAGASVVNNIMGTPLDTKMADVASGFDAPLVIMHIRGTPGTMQEAPAYQDVMAEIVSELRDSIALAEERGVDPRKIIIDPGIGFGKTVLHNLEIIRRLDELKVLGKPILIGPSRKSFIGAILSIERPDRRLMGTAAVVAASIVKGADIVRVHDVKEMVELCAVMDELFKRGH